MKLNLYRPENTIVAALGGLLFGLIPQSLPAPHALTRTFHLTPAALAFTVASALWGRYCDAFLLRVQPTVAPA